MEVPGDGFSVLQVAEEIEKAKTSELPVALTPPRTPAGRFPGLFPPRTRSCCMKIKKCRLTCGVKRNWKGQGSCTSGYQGSQVPGFGSKKLKEACAQPKAQKDCKDQHNGCWRLETTGRTGMKFQGVCYKNARSKRNVEDDCAFFFAALEEDGLRHKDHGDSDPDFSDPGRPDSDPGQDECGGPLNGGADKCFYATKHCFAACKHMMRGFDRGMTTQHPEYYCGYSYTGGLSEATVSTPHNRLSQYATWFDEWSNSHVSPQYIWRAKWAKTALCPGSPGTSCRPRDVPDCSNSTNKPVCDAICWSQTKGCEGPDCGLSYQECNDSCQQKCMDYERSKIPDEACWD